jgi:hypothetical protein
LEQSFRRVKLRGVKFLPCKNACLLPKDQGADIADGAILSPIILLSFRQ